LQRTLFRSAPSDSLCASGALRNEPGYGIDVGALDHWAQIATAMPSSIVFPACAHRVDVNSDLLLVSHAETRAISIVPPPWEAATYGNNLRRKHTVMSYSVNGRIHCVFATPHSVFRKKNADVVVAGNFNVLCTRRCNSHRHRCDQKPVHA